MTTPAQPTPGPLKVGQPRPDGSLWWRVPIFDAEGTTAAVAFGTTAQLAVSRARLIAASPEMRGELLESRAGFAVILILNAPHVSGAVRGFAQENYDRLGALLARIDAPKEIPSNS